MGVHYSFVKGRRFLDLALCLVHFPSEPELVWCLSLYFLGWFLVWIFLFPGVSDGKDSTYNAGDPGPIAGLGRSPGEGKMATHSSILALRILWTEKPGRLQPMESQSQTWLGDWHFNFQRRQGYIAKFSYLEPPPPRAVYPRGSVISLLPVINLHF